MSSGSGRSGGSSLNLACGDIKIYEQSPQTTVVQLDGEFDLVCEPALQKVLDGLCQDSGRSLAVDLSETQFIGVGCLRRVVLAGRGFSSTEFRSPMPLVEKVLQLLGFIDGTVRIEHGAARGVRSSVGGASSRVRRGLPQNAAENERPASWPSRCCSDARGLLNSKAEMGPADPPESTTVLSRALQGCTRYSDAHDVAADQAVADKDLVIRSRVEFLPEFGHRCDSFNAAQLLEIEPQAAEDG